MSNIILDNITINQPVADLTALAAIPTGSLQAGLQVYVISVGISYEWSGSAWTFQGVFPPVANTAGRNAIVTTGFIANKVTVIQVDVAIEYLWNGSAWVAFFQSGADPDGTYLVQTSAGSPANAQIMGVLATGLVKNTTTTGVQSIGADGTDYYGPATITINGDSGASVLQVGLSIGPALGADNVVFGVDSGQSLNLSSSQNTLFGVNVGKTISSGSFNTAFGSGALSAITTATRNVAIGQNALGVSGTSDDCIAIGPSAMASSASSESIGIGDSALNISTTNNDVAVGVNALTLMNAGSGLNVAIGNAAGSLYDTYSNCTFIGAASDATGPGLTNACAIGYQAIVNISNAIALGNECIVGIGTPNPLGSLHISNINSSATFILDPSITPPSLIGGIAQMYSNGNDYFIYDGVGINRPFTSSLIYLQQTNLTFTAINAGPIVLLPANTLNNVVITKILVFTTTAVTGADLIFQSAVPTAIMTFTSASLTTNSINTEQTGTAGAAYFANITNSAVQLTSSGTLTDGQVNVLIEYYLA